MQDTLVFSDPERTREAFRAMGELPWTRAELDDFPIPVWVRFGQTTEGRLVCTGLVIEPWGNREINARLLREIPLTTVLKLGSAGHPAMRAYRADSSAPYRPPKPGPKGWPPDHFQRVADEYRRTLVTHPLAPVKELARRLGSKPVTVHRWLQRCRDMGLLPSRAAEHEEGTS